ncbi:MAG: tetratricopeptide repeat protein [Treponema sp.]|jgi:tetratricopeptide (TPR) repeat protein|nr:tetratricopeptide repeat protein [Treponema sp.]
MMKLLVFLLCAAPLPLLYGDSLPVWFIPLRDAVYEQQLRSDELMILYRQAVQEAEKTLSGQNRYLMLSRCAYMLGRAYQYEGAKETAAAQYEQGIRWAEAALKEGDTAEGWQMLAEHISQSCAVRPVSYALANGLKVEAYAKKALELDARNGAAKYMLAARYVYAPAPFNHYKRGIQMMQEIIKERDTVLQKDDRFNVYAAIGYAYYQQKHYAEARPWFQKALQIYPTNQFVQGMFQNTLFPE